MWQENEITIVRLDSSRIVLEQEMRVGEFAKVPIPGTSQESHAILRLLGRRCIVSQISM